MKSTPWLALPCVMGIRQLAGLRMTTSPVLSILRLALLFLAMVHAWPSRAATPVRFAIVGLVHDHARGFLPSTKARGDVELVAVVEPNRELARRYATSHGLAESLFFTNL